MADHLIPTIEASLREIHTELTKLSPPYGKTFVGHVEMKRLMEKGEGEVTRQLRVLTELHNKMALKRSALYRAQRDANTVHLVPGAHFNHQGRIESLEAELQALEKQEGEAQTMYSMVLNTHLVMLETSIPVDVAGVRGKRAYLLECKRTLLEQLRRIQIRMCVGQRDAPPFAQFESITRAVDAEPKGDFDFLQKEPMPTETFLETMNWRA